MPAVPFVFADWSAMFPEFAGRVVQMQAEGLYFPIACQAIPNSDTGPVADPVARTTLLYLTVAHVAQLYAPTVPGGKPPGLVGRISSAGEGSVSVSADVGPITDSSAWWVQTSYGMTVWKLLAPYRLARYVPPPPRNTDLARLRTWR